MLVLNIKRKDFKMGIEEIDCLPFTFLLKFHPLSPKINYFVYIFFVFYTGRDVSLLETYFAIKFLIFPYEILVRSLIKFSYEVFSL